MAGTAAFIGIKLHQSTPPPLSLVLLLGAGIALGAAGWLVLRLLLLWKASLHLCTLPPADKEEWFLPSQPVTVTTAEKAAEV